VNTQKFYSTKTTRTRARTEQVQNKSFIGIGFRIGKEIIRDARRTPLFCVGTQPLGVTALPLDLRES
jgi:hypothetical protein